MGSGEPMGDEAGGPPAGPDPGHGLPALRPEAGSGTPSRRLSDGEVTRILRLASDADELSALAREGVTVPELARAAEEAGIDPALVARAAAVVEDPSSTLATATFGAPDTRTLRAFVPDRRLPEDHQELARAVETALHRKGQLHESGEGRLVWKEDHTVGRTTVSLTETDGGTDVALEADRAGHYLGSWFAGLVGWGLLTALTPLGQLGPGWAVAGFLVAPFLLARPFWIRADRTRRRRLETAVMAVLERVEAGPALAEAPGEDPEEAPAPGEPH